MATKYNVQTGSVYNTGFSGLFSVREMALKVRGNVLLDVANESAVLSPSDAVTHVRITASTADSEVTLPQAKFCKGRVIRICAINITEDVTVAAASGDTVDGGATKTLAAVGAVELFCTGSAWLTV